MERITDSFEVIDSRGVARQVDKWQDQILVRNLAGANEIHWGLPSYRLGNGGAHLNTADERTFTHYVTGETYTRK